MNTETRSHFPSLSQKVADQQTIYLDGPAGTQVPISVLSAMDNYYRSANANTHGYFAGSAETDALLDRTRHKVATLLNAPSPDCISFGPNMTSLNFSLSRGLSRMFAPGDEVIISQLDHEANRGPWLSLEEKGIVIKEIPLLDNGTLDYDSIPALISNKTKLVAVGMAANIFGTVNNIAKIKSLLPDDTLLLLDAVHYAPHFSIDVQELDCDFLLCSAYKFYGPHVGLLYSRPGLLDQVPTDRLRTQDQTAPHSIETGTLNHAAIAGVEAAIDFIADLGAGKNLRQKLISAYDKISAHENKLMRRLAAGIAAIPSLQLWGPDPAAMRAPTLAFTSEIHSAADICKNLGSRGINAWDGHFYALRAVEILGLLERGGVTRMGMAIYNTEEEIDRTLDALLSV